MLLARPFFLRKPFHHYIQPIKTLLVRYAYELVALDDTQMGFGHFTQVPNGISQLPGSLPSWPGCLLSEPGCHRKAGGIPELHLFVLGHPIASISAKGRVCAPANGEATRWMAAARQYPVLRVLFRSAMIRL
jgi:hypothetical protein